MSSAERYSEVLYRAVVLWLPVLIDALIMRDSHGTAFWEPSSLAPMVPEDRGEEEGGLIVHKDRLDCSSRLNARAFPCC